MPLAGPSGECVVADVESPVAAGVLAWSDDEPRQEALVVVGADAGQRLDRLLAARLPELSRAAVQVLIDAGQVRVEGRARKPSYRPKAGDRVEVLIPPPVPVDIRPEPIPLSVVFEDDDLLVVDKPAGMVVHPAPGHQAGTLVNAVLAYLPSVRINGSIRPGIVHRLDRETSGLLVVAKHERALAALAAQFQERRTLKVYLALLDGVVDPAEGTIDVPVARDPRNRQRMAARHEGRPALSHFRVIERFARHTLVEVRIESGRTHQIRVHCAFIGRPVTGDPLYGAGGHGSEAVPELPLGRQFLHAARLGLWLPSGPWREFTSPLPPDLAATLAALRERTG